MKNELTKTIFMQDSQKYYEKLCNVTKTIVKGSVLILIALMVLLVSPGKAQAKSLKVKGKITGRTSYKISWSGDQKYTHWRIRRSLKGKDGAEGTYKTIKINKRKKKNFTVKKLKKNRQYYFEVSFGVMKNGKYTPRSDKTYFSFYTGMPEPDFSGWYDYAEVFNLCSPNYIDVNGSCDSCYDNSSLRFKGYQIYRRKKGEKKYKKIATVKKDKEGNFHYRDKKVKKGGSYQYKIRTYGTYKGKKLYSPFSIAITRAAINFQGKYRMEKVSYSADELVVKLESDKYNAKLVLMQRGLAVSRDSLIYEKKVDEYGEEINWRDYYESEYEAGFGMLLKAYSKDNKSWYNLAEFQDIVIKAGQTIYLRLVPYETSEKLNLDPAKQLVLVGDDVHYNGLSSYINLPDGKEGLTKFNWGYIF